MRRDRFQQQPLQPPDMISVLAASGLSEVFEIFIEDLGPYGMKAIGITPILQLLEKAGAEKKFSAHLLDMGVRAALLSGLRDYPVLREILIGVSDAYFDKMKALLVANPTVVEYEQARGLAMTAARARMKELLSKEKEKEKAQTMKPAFSQLVQGLTPEEKSRYTEMVEQLVSASTAHDPAQRRAGESRLRTWDIFKEKILSVDELRYILSLATIERRVAYIVATHGHVPNELETLRAALHGEETPQTQALSERVQEFSASAQAYTSTQEARSQAVRDRNTPILIPLWLSIVICSVVMSALIIASIIIH